MKKLFILIAMGVGIMLCSCVDKEYDLSQIESDDIAIGSDDSEFLMPLVNIKFKTADISLDVDGASSIMDLQSKVNVWLPSQLPGGVSYVDVQQLTDSREYKQSLLDNLYAEMLEDDVKRAEVCAYVIKEYRAEVVEMLCNSENQVVASTAAQIDEVADDAQAAEVISMLFVAYPSDVQVAFNEISDEDLINLKVEDVVVDIPSLDVSEDVVNMLTDNIGNGSVNALYLFGEAESDFPFLFHISPSIDNTGVDFGDISIDNGVTKINETRIYKEDFDAIMDGARLTVPITLDRYYPESVISNDNELNLSISLRKTGGLKL